MNFTMYHGDEKNEPSEPGNYRQGSESSVSTARECFAIFDQCVAEGRFPGEHSLFESSTNSEGVLLEVVNECGRMQPFLASPVNDGWIMSNPENNMVVGFVLRRASGTLARGVAYIGG